MIIYPSKIKGNVKISGSKNAALPIIAASLVSARNIKLKNVPNIDDINNLLIILSKIGCRNVYKNKTLKIDNEIKKNLLLFDEVKKFRASYYLMSVFIALFGEVEIYYPGGCAIGSRPIDFHLEGFKSAGCTVVENDEVIKVSSSELKPFIYRLKKKSLGATVNLIILGSKIEGTSIIKNASTEPEIDDLITFINKGSSKVYRKNNDVIIVGNNGVVSKINHKIIPDRIECFTYMCIGLNSEKLKIKNVNKNHLAMPICFFKNAGADIKVNKKSLIVKKSILKNIRVNSGDYPSLSTDQMPLLYPVFTRVIGVSVFVEGIFENRFCVCDELKKTNANIAVMDNKVFIYGKKDICGASLFPTDLRAAASLLIEGVINQNSTIYNLNYLERGYDDIYKKLKKIGLNFKLE